MIIVSGKVFNLEGKTVPVRGENRFVLNFTVSEYLGKKDDVPQYRGVSVAVWDKRGESLEKLLKEKSIVQIASNHYRAEAFKSEKNQSGLDAKIKIEIWSNDDVNILHTPEDANTGSGAVNRVTESDFSEDDPDPFKEPAATDKDEKPDF